MFSAEERRIAIETFIKYDHSYADTVAELGYPHRVTLRLWWREYESTGEIPVGKGHRKSKYTDDQALVAVRYYLEHGRSLSRRGSRRRRRRPCVRGGDASAPKSYVAEVSVPTLVAISRDCALCGKRASFFTTFRPVRRFLRVFSRLCELCGASSLTARDSMESPFVSPTQLAIPRNYPSRPPFHKQKPTTA